MAASLKIALEMGGVKVERELRLKWDQEVPREQLDDQKGLEASFSPEQEIPKALGNAVMRALNNGTPTLIEHMFVELINKITPKS